MEIKGKTTRVDYTPDKIYITVECDRPKKIYWVCGEQVKITD